MLIVRGVEVTQAIQYFYADQHLTDPADRGPDNSLALVANKAAWVRVYIESDAPGAIPNVGGTLNVSYGIFNERGGQPSLTLNPQPPGKVMAQFMPDYATTRSSTTLTLNFIIPGDRMYGPLVLQAKVTDGNQTVEKDIFIRPTLQQTLRVRGIMIGYNGPDPTNPANNLTIAAPGLADLQTTAAWALRVMPVEANGEFEVASTITRSGALTGTATNGGCAVGWLSLNSAITVAKVADGNHPGFLYYGLIASTFPNLSNNGGCESSGVSSGFNGGQIAFAHEVGHACGRAHAPCGSVGTSADANYPAYEPYDSVSAHVASIGEFGLDITNGAVATPNTARDYMSYCGPGWISIYGHQALIENQALNPKHVGVRRPWWDHYVRYDPWWWLHYKPDPPPYWIDPQIIRENPARMQKVIALIGILHADERLEVLSVTRSEVMNVTLEGGTTDMRVTLEGARGVELSSAPLIAMNSQASCGCKDDGPQCGPRLVQAFVPDVAVGMSLSVRRGPDSLWKRTAPRGKMSLNKPSVRAVNETMLDITWKAVVPGGATDTWVRVSIDEGKTWVALATGLAKNKAEIDRTHLPAGKCLIEVVVHDGFRSMRSTAVEFQNSALPPVPAILHPHEGRVLVAGHTLYLWGSVAGQRSQSHEGFRYVWKLDGKPVGEGLHVFTVTPSAGSHRCELLVQNARGKALRASSVEFTSEADTR